MKLTLWVQSLIIVVSFGDQLGFYTPGDVLVPCGQLSVHDEGAKIYVCDRHESRWVNPPVAKPAVTRIHRTGHFHLDDEGTLQGTIEIEMTGHVAREERDGYRGRSATDALTKLRTQLTERLTTAEPSELTWNNLEDNTRPFVVSYTVRIPGYGERVGRRIVLPLNFFTANIPSVFTSETRKYPIFFGFAQQSIDDVELVLPDGYSPDGASAPANVGNANSIVSATYTLKYNPKSQTFLYHREQVIGAESIIKLKPDIYPSLREVFDYMRQSDVHQLVIKPAPAEAIKIPTSPGSAARSSTP